MDTLLQLPHPYNPLYTHSFLVYTYVLSKRVSLAGGTAPSKALPVTAITYSFMRDT